LHAIGVQAAAALVDQPTAAKVVIAGVVTHRQRPSTAGGVVFMNLEDETGLVNVVCSPGCWIRFKKELHAPAVIIRGRLERVGEVCNVVAERVEMLDLAVNVAKSRDFR
jgi:error-prone DNA polymerase